MYASNQAFFSVTGFRGWDNESTGIDINEELAQIANKAALGEEGPGGGYFFFSYGDGSHIETYIEGNI